MCVSVTKVTVLLKHFASKGPSIMSHLGFYSPTITLTASAKYLQNFDTADGSAYLG